MPTNLIGRLRRSYPAVFSDSHPSRRGRWCCWSSTGRHAAACASSRLPCSGCTADYLAGVLLRAAHGRSPGGRRPPVRPATARRPDRRGRSGLRPGRAERRRGGLGGQGTLLAISGRVHDLGMSLGADDLLISGRRLAAGTLSSVAADAIKRHSGRRFRTSRACFNWPAGSQGQGSSTTCAERPNLGSTRSGARP